MKIRNSLQNIAKWLGGIDHSFDEHNDLGGKPIIHGY